VVTCRVPVELRTLFAFTPGQHVTAKAVLDVSRSGARIRCVRRRPSWLLSVQCESASGLCPVALLNVSRSGTYQRRRAGRAATGRNFVTTLDPQRRRHYGAIVGGSGITPVLSLVGTALRQSKAAASPCCTQPIHRFNDARRRIGRPEEPLSRTAAPTARVLSGGSPVRPTRRPVRPRHAAQHLRPHPGANRSPRMVFVRPAGLVRNARRILTDRGATLVHTELFHAEEKPGPTLRPVVSTAGATR